MSLLAWGVILFLIVVCAFYVAAEFAAVSVRRSRVHQLADEGNRLAQLLLPHLEDPHRLDSYIAACQIGITLTSLILGAVGQATIGRDLGKLLTETAGMSELAGYSSAAMIVLVFLTTLQMVFGELVPKSLALQFPTRTALATYLPMAWSLVLYRFFISFLNGSGMLILRALGMPQTASHRHIHSPDELEMVIAESREGGLLEPEEQERLHQALRLSKRTARQLMVPRRFVAAIDVETPAEQALQIVIDSPYTRLPVYRGTIDQIIGLLHTKDLAARYAATGKPPTVRRLLRPITTVPSTVTADRLIALLRERRSRLAVVVDEFGGVEGIVTLEDVLAELLGAIVDEFKQNQPTPERLPDGRVRLPGLLRLDDAATWTGVHWQDDVADTVGGLVLATLGIVPVGGEKVTIKGVAVEVERMNGQVIESLLVTPKESASIEAAPAKEA